MQAAQAQAQSTAQQTGQAATTLADRVSALERRAPPQPSPELATRLAALEQRVAQLAATPAPPPVTPGIPPDWASRIEALERRVTLAQAGTPTGTPAAPQQGAPPPAESAGTAPPSSDHIAALERTLGSVEESLSRISTALAALERRMAALEAAPRPAARGAGRRKRCRSRIRAGSVERGP
jgi:hypothetical protein